MRLMLLHARLATLTLVRHPSFVVPTVAFPALFFLFFASSARGAVATYALCSFAAFSALGVAFFQFGVGIAAERESPWEHVLRALPVSAGVRLAARLLAATVFAAAASACVIVAALATTDASLPPVGWARLLGALALGIVPFALLGIAVGYWATPRGALPIANVLYFGLAYAGGLWITPDRLPHVVQTIGPYLPTRHLAALLVAVARGTPWDATDWTALAAFAVVFAVAAFVGYRRDERSRHG